MKFEQTVQYYFDNMSSLFQTRSQVLEHLFLVIGNGYDWIDGQLVDIDCEVNEDDIVLKGGDKAKQIYKLDNTLNIWGSDNYDENTINYPPCDSSNVFTFKEDIQADWLEGVKDTVILLLQREVDTRGFNDWQHGMNNKTNVMINQLANKLGIV